MNLNKLAVKITKAEGLKEQVSIAQVKEVMKLVFKEVVKMSVKDLAALAAKYK